MIKTSIQLELEGNAWVFTELDSKEWTSEYVTQIQVFRINRAAVPEKSEPAKNRIIVILNTKKGESVFTITDVNNINNKKIFSND